MVVSVQGFAELSLKLSPLQLPPGCATAAASFCLGPLLLAGVTLRPREVGLHLNGVAITLARVQLNGFPENFDHLGSNPCCKPVVTDARPVKRPFRQLTREQPVQDESHREYVGLKLGTTHGLLRRNVVDSPRTGRFERPKAYLCKAKVRQFELVTGKQNEILRLDVAVDNSMAMTKRSSR
jgi:hypothetical protein